MNVWHIEQHAKERGQSLAASANHTDLRIARAEAKRLAGLLGTVHADDVRCSLIAGSTGVVWGNWAGSLFRGKEWMPAGFVKATHKGSHHRMIRLWRLRA